MPFYHHEPCIADVSVELHVSKNHLWLAICMIPRETLFPRRFRQRKVYYSKHSRSISYCKSQSLLDRARNHHHLNL